ncbi:class I SAM-dependent methyltransferase [Natronococcus wangiae]|uniref:class I SAM-dependent methyltransferase n=1 Tax=Natronococcus wangiae TaxID=3068275 RepID=UPI00273FB32F|nr:methyltransferase domain-containing protein [Natronococcus sp. AD5]
MIARRTVRRLGALGGLVLVAGLAYALRWRKNPSPCPYSQRVWLDLPRPVITRSRLRELLAPRPGEDVLEVGSGTGYYTDSVAQALEPGGTVHALDVQRRMLERTRARTSARGSRNVAPVQADVRTLPYPDDGFDAAHLVAVLGEVPDRERVLSELHRVLKPGGRLVVGELLPDPHFVALETIHRRAERQGFRFDDYVGTRFGYIGRFLVPVR